MGGRLGSRQPQADSQAWVLLPQYDRSLACGEQPNRIVPICLSCLLISSHWLVSLFSSLTNFVYPSSPPLSLFFVFCLFGSEFRCVTLARLELVVQIRPASKTHSVVEAGIEYLSLLMPPKYQGLCL